jgi:phosphoribosyl 1,2-cyclic phosphodiesterase
MEITFYGVRGSIPVPGPGTVRYGGNTGCVLVRLSDGGLLILDCGTGARTLGLALQARDFARGPGSATFLLSHAHWDHLQGFPFFRPFYGAANRFVLYGGAPSPERLEEVLEGQMAAQYFPLQTFRNMDAVIEIRALPGLPSQAVRSFSVGAARVSAHATPHGAHLSFAFRIEDAGKVLAYATDVGYGAAGPSPQALALYANADLLIHDATFGRAGPGAGAIADLSPIDVAVDAALAAGARQLALYHYDQGHTDHDIDELIARGRRRQAQMTTPDGRGQPQTLIGAAEGLTVRL